MEQNEKPHAPLDKPGTAESPGPFAPSCPGCPVLNIVIQIVGSRGDVQPYLSLAIELILLGGHRVRIATHADFKEFVLGTGRKVLRRRWAAMVRSGHEKARGRTIEHGEKLCRKLEFFTSGGSPKDLMAYMVKSKSRTCKTNTPRLTCQLLGVTQDPGLIPGYESLVNGDIPAKRKMIKEVSTVRTVDIMLTADPHCLFHTCAPLLKILQNLYYSLYYPNPETGENFACDAIIANPPSFAAVHLAEAFGLPLMFSFSKCYSIALGTQYRVFKIIPAMAWSPTSQWTHPLVNIKQTNASTRLSNYLSFGLAELMTWQGLASVINKFRTKTLGLQALSNREGAGLADRLKIPFMYCWSPSVIPKPEDWKEHIGK